jgi:phage recombination protein Bet
MTMSNNAAIKKVTDNTLAQAPAQLSRQQIDLIKRTIAKGCTDDELQLFVAAATRLGLDPFSNQIYAIKRWDGREGREVMKIQTSVDGYRSIAERTGSYEGQVGPEWCGADGKWRDVWLSDDEPPKAARVGIWKSGFREPLYSVARYSSYVQRTREGNVTAMWKRMADVMIAKCAESAALRRAFPHQLSGVYTDAEMGQANNPPPVHIEPEQQQQQQQQRPQLQQRPQQRPQQQRREDTVGNGKRPVDKFAREIRAAWSQEDLKKVGVGIAKAKSDGKLNDGEAAVLKGIYAETRSMISDRASESGKQGEQGEQEEEQQS